jgi:DNA-binding beta-propeller fold protein YncE
VVVRSGLALALCLLVGVACTPQTSATLKPKTCTTAVAASSEISGLRSTSTALLGNPSDVVATSDGRWSFAALANGDVAVLSLTGPAPVLTRMILLPGRPVLTGLNITHDGRQLLVADGAGGVIVLDVGLAETEGAHAVVGSITSRTSDGGAALVVSSMDDRFAYVSLEKASAIAVFDLRAGTFVGSIPVATAPVGIAPSPDGRWLYVTSELASPASDHGTLSVIDLDRGSVVTTVSAGCGPVRVVTSPDGAVVWIAARESNAVIAFSAAALASDPGHALLATVQVGQAPVGLAVLGGGEHVVVADSNRFLVAGSRSDLTIIDAAAAFRGDPAILGTIPTGEFPRGLAVVPNGQIVLVANFNSKTIQSIDLGRVPGR